MDLPFVNLKVAEEMDTPPRYPDLRQADSTESVGTIPGPPLFRPERNDSFRAACLKEVLLIASMTIYSLLLSQSSVTITPTLHVLR